MSKSKLPRKWIDVYPQGTTEGDEEQKFFIALARSKWDWRSVGMLAKETGLTKERVEEIIQKYYNMKPPMVIQSPSNEDNWGYWERVAPDGENTPTITEQDQDDRIDEATPAQNP